MMIVLIAVSLACAFLGVRLRTWTVALLAVPVLMAAVGAVTLSGLVLTALLLAAVLLPLNVVAWRQKWLSAPFLKQYMRMLPALSDTEAAAMKAGTVGWEGEVFSGRPDWDRLLDIPWLELSTDEQAFLDGPVEALCGMLRDWEIAHERADLPPQAWQFLKDERFFGMIIPREYGGLGFSALAHRAVLQKVSSISAVAGTTVAVPNSLGPGELILHYGTEEQKNHYLPRLARGEEIPCFALTGPSAGSDATSIPDRGVVCEGEWQGEKVLGIQLNFDKRYITLAPVATLVGLAFRMYDPDGLLGGAEDLGISLALVPHDAPGVEIGERHLALDVPFQNGPVRGRDVFVPLDALIGGQDMAGKGWRMLVEALSVGRGITLPSSSTGGAKLGAMATGAYARIRRQFNLPIGRFEGIEEAMARIAGKTYTISALSRLSATSVDLGEKPAVASAIAKHHATEMAREIVTDVMDIHGGKGIMMGPRNYLGRAWMGMPIWITVEGANIMTRSLMIFGQGAIRCHPYVMREMRAARLADPVQRLETFDALLFGHIGFSIRNAVRSLLLGLSFTRLARAPARGDRRLARHYRKLSRYSAILAFCADVAMLTQGGKLKQKERLSARLGDVLSHLYMGSAVLYRHQARGCPASDQPLVAWSIHHSAYRMQEAIHAFLDNFPIRWLGVLMRGFVFPLGRRDRAPGDRLSHRVAQLLLAPSEARSRLTDGVHFGTGSTHPVALMELALPQVIAAEPLERKLRKAARAGEISGHDEEERLASALRAGLVSATEAEALRQSRALVREVIAVDAFPDQALRPGARADTEVRKSNAA